MNASNSDAPPSVTHTPNVQSVPLTGADSSAAECTIVQQFEPAIRCLARHYSGGDHDLQRDLAQEGFIGLVNAHRKFKISGGASLATYADRHIRGRMKNYLRSESRHNCCITWTEYRGVDDDAQEVDVDPQCVTAREAIDTVTQFLLAIDVQLIRQSLQHATNGFTPKQVLIFRLRFLDGLTVSEISARLSISAARVSQVLTEAVSKVKEGFFRV